MVWFVRIKSITSVRVVNLVKTVGYHFVLVKFLQRVPLLIYILMYGDQPQFVLLLDFGIMLSLSTIVPGKLGFILFARNLKYLDVSKAFKE